MTEVEGARHGEELAPVEFNSVFASFLPPGYQQRDHLPVVPESFYEDEADTADEPNISGEHYAWPNILRWMNQRHESRENTKGDVFYVDLCSAFPIHAELIDSRLFTFSGELASKLMAVGTLQLFEDGHLTDNPELAVNLPHIRQTICTPKRPSGELLSAALQQALYKLQPGDIDFQDPEQARNCIAAMIAYELRYNTKTFKTTNGSDTYEMRMSIHTTVQDRAKTFIEELAAMKMSSERSKALRQLVGPLVVAAAKRNGEALFDDRMILSEELFETDDFGTEAATTVADSVAGFFAGRLVRTGYARPQRVVSVDIAGTEELLSDAPKSFDLEHQRSALFARTCERVKNGVDHWQMDIFSDDLETIADSSVTMFTVFDGFPFYFGEASMPEQPNDQRREQWLTFAERLYRKMQPGGHLLIFPWDVKDMTENDQVLLDDMVRLWLDYEKGPGDKAEVATKKYLKRTLQAWMQPMEMKLSDHSPILQVEDPEHIFEALLVVKAGVSHRFSARRRQILAAQDPRL